MIGTALIGLRSIPLWVYALVAILAWGGWQRHIATRTAAKFEAARAVAAKEREDALVVVIAETARRQAAQIVIAENAKAQTAKARSAAAAASAAAASLRDKLHAIQASYGAGSASAIDDGATARLADLLARCADRYRDVAARADAAIIAGLACERSYDSLSSPRGNGAGPN